MVSRSKLYNQLDALEAELRESIIPHLEKAAAGENDLIFCVKDFNPFDELKNNTDMQTESLVNLGAQILALKGKLNESTDGSIAERICWYCREWSELENTHRKSAIGLAKQFLQEIADKS